MQVFGIEHIIYMVVMIVVMTIAIIVLKKFVPKNKMVLPIKIFAGIELILIIIYRIVVSKSRSGTFIDFISSPEDLNLKFQFANLNNFDF